MPRQVTILAEPPPSSLVVVKRSRSESPGTSQTSESRRAWLRSRILHDHLAQATRALPGDEGHALEDGLTYTSAISLLTRRVSGIEFSDGVTRPDGAIPSSVDNTPPAALGGLSEDDLKRYASPGNFVTPRAQTQITAELKNTLLSILDYYSDEEAEWSEKERLHLASLLPDQVRRQQERIDREHGAVRDCHARIQKLVKLINQSHPRLEDELASALTTLPPLLNATRSAQADVLSLTIETCLLKLSVARARAHLALYGHTSPTRPRATMPRALAAMQEKLLARQRAQAAEERELDRQIAAYEQALGLVGGREGGFAQVVEDMARVKRETEECRKDLRRLGWTGD